MQIRTGLFDNMTMQRDRTDTTDQVITGSTLASAAVTARVTKKRRAVRGISRVSIGRSTARGTFTARLRGVPVGGPYDITLTARTANGDEEVVTVCNVVVGDVWLMAGQSNMEGIGDLSGAPKPHPMVRAFYMDNHWDMAREPLHELYKAHAPVHRIISPDVSRNPHKGVGCGISFARTMLKETGVPQGLIASAHGGTSMAQWKAARGDRCLFGATINRVVRNGGRVRGVLWYQGESDANPDEAPKYTRRMVRLCTAFRSHLGAVPVAVVQISRVADVGVVDGLSDGASWSWIREQQRLLPEKISRLAVVPAIDLELDDRIHIGAAGHAVLGRRLVEAMRRLSGDRDATAPITLRGVRTVEDTRTGTWHVEARFGNVVGELCAEGCPNGFALTDGHRRLDPIYKTTLHGHRVRLHTDLTRAIALDLSVSYGYGTNPLCTIVDKAGRSLPAFGPIPLGQGPARTGFIGEITSSTLRPWPGTIRHVQYPTGRLRFEPTQFQQFWHWSRALMDRDATEGMVFFRYRFSCSEPMRLRLLFGYDGPVRLFYDRRSVFIDAGGTNPIQPDEQTVHVQASKGSHEVMFALGANAGNACGVCLRIARLDRKVVKGRVPALPVAV